MLSDAVLWYGMTHPAQLPEGFDPVAAGRAGLWLMGQRQHRAKNRRVAFPARVYRVERLACHFAALLTPWRVWEYPGIEGFLCELCGVKRHTVKRWLCGYPIAPHHARRMADYVDAHVVQCLALSRELGQARGGALQRATRPASTPQRR